MICFYFILNFATSSIKRQLSTKKSMPHNLIPESVDNSQPSHYLNRNMADVIVVKENLAWLQIWSTKYIIIDIRDQFNLIMKFDWSLPNTVTKPTVKFQWPMAYFANID